MCVYVCTAMMSDRIRKFLKSAGCSVVLCNNMTEMIVGVVDSARKHTLIYTHYVYIYIYIIYMVNRDVVIVVVVGAGVYTALGRNWQMARDDYDSSVRMLDRIVRANCYWPETMDSWRIHYYNYIYIYYILNSIIRVP